MKNTKRSGFTLIELLIIIAMIAIIAGLFGGCGCSFQSSKGERTGNVTKLSYKGVFGNSWEGEMVLGGIRTTSDGGVAANIWQFTVPQDENLLSKIRYASEHGTRITIKYHQPFFYNTFKNRSGGYFVDGVSIVSTNIAENPFN